MNNFEIDGLSREKIVTEIDQNFFVEAGAGSGKTTMLVNRMVAMVEAGVDISKISAITFTRAAAGEFYDRFQKKLIERSNVQSAGEGEVRERRPGDLNPPTEESRKRCEQALQNIDLCFMGTIDSFCNMILSEHPFDALIPSDSSIISEDELKVILSRLLVKIGEGSNEIEEEKRAVLKQKYENFCSVHRNPKEVFLAAMPILLRHRNAEFHYAQNPLPVDLDNRFSDEKKFLGLMAAAFLKNRGCIRPKFGNEGKYGYYKFARSFYSLFRSWNGNFPLVYDAVRGLAETQIYISPSRIGQGAERYLTEGRSRAATYYILNMDRPGGLIDQLDEIRYDITMDFLMECVPFVEKYKKEKGQLTYFDYLFYLRNMLKKDAGEGGKMISYIRNRHSYFLIDEFQDTDPMQAEIFFYLSAVKPEINWRRCVPAPGSLFIVGDPKQSIYRFRSADVTSFLTVKSLFTEEAGEVLSLPCNFRSTKKLITYFNQVFEKLLEEDINNPGIQCAFDQIPIPAEKDSGLTGVYKYETVSGKYADNYPDEKNELRIGKIIATLVGNEKYQIVTPDVEGNHPIRYKDIMLITFSKRNLSELMPYLNEHGIPTRVEGKVLFEENEALIEICKIYRYAADLLNQKALYGALTGKLINLTFEDILRYRIKGGTMSFFISPEAEKSEDEDIKKVVSKIKQLNVLQKKALTLSPAALFGEIMENFRVYETVDADHLEVLYYTLELLKNAEKSGVVVSAKDALEYMEILMSGESDEERCLSVKEDIDCVHMANLHKLKGLEAPVVILSYAGFNNSLSASLRIEHNEEKTEGWLFNVNSEFNKDFIRTTYFGTEAYTVKAMEELDALRAEEARLVYVAATRARNVLIINDNRYFKMNYGGLEPVYNSRWSVIKQEDMPDFFKEFEIRDTVTSGTDAEYEDAVKLYEKANEECVLQNRNAEEKSYVTLNPSKLKLTSKMDDEQITLGMKGPHEKKDTGKDMRYAALTGTVVHRYMEMLAESKDTVILEEAVEEILREFSTPVNAEYEDTLRKILKNVAKKIHEGGYDQKGESEADILKILKAASAVFCEVPFCYRTEADGKEQIVNGVMDLVYCDGKDWHIVDYKTNLDEEGLDKKYKEQLEACSRAFEAITGLKADARIYHIEV